MLVNFIYIGQVDIYVYLQCIYTFIKIADSFELSMARLAEFFTNKRMPGNIYQSHYQLWERRSNLQGHIIKAGWVEGVSDIYTYIYNDGSIGIGGPNYELFGDLARRCNFTFDLIRKNVIGAEAKDGSWTGLIKGLITKDLDIGVSDFVITYERSQQIDFSIGIRKTKFALFMKASKSNLNWETFTEVFSNGFWRSLLALIITLAIFLSITRLSSNGKNHSKGAMDFVNKAIILCLAILTIFLFTILQGMRQSNSPP